MEFFLPGEDYPLVRQNSLSARAQRCQCPHPHWFITNMGPKRSVSPAQPETNRHRPPGNPNSEESSTGDHGSKKEPLHQTMTSRKVRGSCYPSGCSLW